MLLSIPYKEFHSSSPEKEFLSSRDMGTTRLLTFGAVFFIFLVLISVLRGDGTTAPDMGRYALPTTKAYIEPCARAALALHPGTMETLRMLHRDGDFLVRYAIAGDDGSEWAILCNGSTRGNRYRAISWSGHSACGARPSKRSVTGNRSDPTGASRI
jgi:hypothetical protein